jgi:hypothetical protein
MNEPTELEKQIKRSENKKISAKILEMILESKIALSFMATGLTISPLIMNYCKDKDGYINIPEFLAIELAVMVIPTIFVIRKIWKM